MGLFDRRATAPQAKGAFWKHFRARANERPINYASLRCVSGEEVYVGTLFLTDQRLAWVAGDPKRPFGGFETKLDDVIGCGPIEGVSDPGTFLVALTLGGQEGVLLFYSQRPRSRANVVLAEQMHRSIASALSEHWQSKKADDSA